MKQTFHVSIDNFKNKIADTDIYSKMNKDIDSDPNINYDIIHNILKSATKKHLAPGIMYRLKHMVPSEILLTI